jgi:hypothetical protein
MSIQERQAIVSFLSSIVITAVYAAFMLQRYPQADAYSPEIFRYWGAFFLILIPVTIVARILITIVFSILNTVVTHEPEPAIMDERDKLIALKATRSALVVFVAGFLLAMVSLVADMPPATMFIILIFSGVASGLASDLSEIYFYRRGV